MKKFLFGEAVSIDHFEELIFDNQYEHELPLYRYVRELVNTASTEDFFYEMCELIPAQPKNSTIRKMFRRYLEDVWGEYLNDFYDYELSSQDIEELEAA